MNTTIQLTMQWKAGHFSKGVKRLARVLTLRLYIISRLKSGKIYLLLSPAPKCLHGVEFNQIEGRI
jgi:hypothetical protein